MVRCGCSLHSLTWALRVAGLKKQLAMHRATLVREQRKREQQQREAMRQAQLPSENEEQFDFVSDRVIYTGAHPQF